MQGPTIGRDLAETVGRLGGVRRQIKSLETEESVLRQQVMNAIADWPQEWFPIRVAGYELKRQQRTGKIDVEEATKILSDKGLLDQVETEPLLLDSDALINLRVDLARQPMPTETRQQLTGEFERAIGWQPVITAEEIQQFYIHHRLEEAEWRLCFRDLKPVTLIISVR